MNILFTNELLWKLVQVALDKAINLVYSNLSPRGLCSKISRYSSGRWDTSPDELSDIL
jgi:hypothetical protein